MQRLWRRSGKDIHEGIPHAVSRHGQRNGPSTPLHQDPSGIHWWGDCGHGRVNVPGEYVLAPSESPTGNKKNTWQNYIWSCANIWLGLVSRVHWCQLDPHSCSRRHCHDCSPTQTQSPSARPGTAEAAKWLREDSSVRWPRSHDWHSSSQHRSTLHQSKLWWHWNPLPLEPLSQNSPSQLGWYCSPSPNPPCPHPADKQLNYSLSDLHLHPQQWVGL